MDIEESVIAIPVRASRMLSARVWKPRGAGKWPAIVDSAPYRSGDIFRPVLERHLPWLAAQGYATVAIDIAGAGNSPGILSDEYAEQEIEDLVGAIEGIARTDWCDGNVGLSGFSWAAFAALRASIRRPPALKAMVLGGVSEDGWLTDIHYLGGALYTAQVDWAGVMLMFNALPPDPREFAGDWRAEWKARLEANVPWIVRWLSHQDRDAYWAEKAARLEDAPAIPLLLFAGLADRYAISALRIAARWPGFVRTIIGPWEHAMPNTAARKPRIGILQEQLRWWDAHLKHRENGASDLPPLRLWLGEPDSHGAMEQGSWIAATLPASDAPRLDFAVRGSRLVEGAEPDAKAMALTAANENPASLGSDLYEDAPAQTDLARAATNGARVALSDPFERDVEFGLRPVLSLATEARDGVLVARLFDVAPDGSAIRLCVGACNLAYERSGTVELIFQAAAWRLKKGHCLAVAISAGGWPTFWPSPNSEIAVSALKLSIPLIERLEGLPPPQFESAVTFDAVPPEAPKWIDVAKVRLPEPQAGAASHASTSAYHLPQTGTDYLIASRFDLVAGEGGAARARRVFHVAFERPDWRIAIDGALTVSSSKDEFHIDWRIDASVDAKEFHRGEGRVSIPRKTV